MTELEELRFELIRLVTPYCPDADLALAQAKKLEKYITGKD